MKKGESKQVFDAKTAKPGDVIPVGVSFSNEVENAGTGREIVHCTTRAGEGKPRQYCRFVLDWSDATPEAITALARRSVIIAAQADFRAGKLEPDGTVMVSEVGNRERTALPPKERAARDLSKLSVQDKAEVLVDSGLFKNVDQALAHIRKMEK